MFLWRFVVVLFRRLGAFGAVARESSRFVGLLVAPAARSVPFSSSARRGVPTFAFSVSFLALRAVALSVSAWRSRWGFSVGSSAATAMASVVRPSFALGSGKVGSHAVCFETDSVLRVGRVRVAQLVHCCVN